MSDRSLTVMLTACGLALFLFYYRFDPQVHSFFPLCPFKSLTGFDCPGCGSQRALHALLHGRLAAAAGFNLLAAAAVPLFTVKIAGNWYDLYSGRKVSWDWGTPGPVLTVIVCCFWILRNLRCFPFDLLAT